MTCMKTAMFVCSSFIASEIDFLASCIETAMLSDAVPSFTTTVKKAMFSIHNKSFITIVKTAMLAHDCQMITSFVSDSISIVTSIKPAMPFYDFPPKNSR